MTYHDMSLNAVSQALIVVFCILRLILAKLFKKRFDLWPKRSFERSAKMQIWKLQFYQLVSLGSSDFTWKKNLTTFELAQECTYSHHFTVRVLVLSYNQQNLGNGNLAGHSLSTVSGVIPCHLVRLAQSQCAHRLGFSRFCRISYNKL